MLKSSASIAIVVALFVAAVGITWWQRGEMKDREFAARIQLSPHKTDTVTIVKEIPQAPVHSEPGAQPAIETPAVDSAVIQAERSSADSLRALAKFLAAPVDVTIRHESGASVRLQYNPLTRIPVADFQPAPVREIKTIITDSVRVPIPEHDSWTTRATLVTAGAAAGVIIMAIAH